MDEYRGVGADTARAIDREVRKVLSQAHRVAHKILSVNRATIETTAQRLIERETIEADEVRDLFAGIEIPRGREPELVTAGSHTDTVLHSRVHRQRSAGRARRRTAA
jgi:cell division protease FtsH